MKNIKSILAVVLAVFSVLCLAACGNSPEVPETTSPETTLSLTENDTTESGTTENGGLWADAVYPEDTELGKGAKTVICEVKAEDKTVTFTLKTDKTVLGDALLDCGLVEGDEGPYGLYIKK